MWQRRTSEGDSTRAGLGGFWSQSPIRLIRVTMVVLALAAGTWLIVRTLIVREWPDRANPTANLERPKRATLTPVVVEALERDGIVVRPNVRRMLDALLGMFSRRDDLRKSFSVSGGVPNLPALLQWAETFPDSSAVVLAPHLGAIEELRSRMGYLPANARVAPVLFWVTENRRYKTQDITLVLEALTELWEERADVRSQFLEGNHVDVVGLLAWAERVPPSDPAYKRFLDSTIPIHEVVTQIRAAKRG